MGTARRTRLALFIGALFLALGSLGAVGSWGAYLLDTNIVREGERADARVTRKDFLFVADGTSDYTIDYWFALPGGERVSAHRGVPKALWDRLQVGSTFVVAYSPSDPKRNFPLGAGVTSLSLTVFVSLLSVAIAAVGALLIVGHLRVR